MTKVVKCACSSTILSALATCGFALLAYDEVSRCLVIDESLRGGFTLKRESRNEIGGSVTYKRGIDRISVSVRVSSPDKFDWDWWECTTPNLHVEHPQALPWSGLPVGTRCRVNGSPGSSTIHAGAGDYVVGSGLFARSASESDLQLQEGACRYGLAKLVGLGSEDAGEAHLDGRVLRGCRKIGTGAACVGLDEFERATGTDVVYNKTRGTAYWVYEGREYVYPLAAVQVKRDGAWTECDTALFWHGGRWFVPVNLLR